MQIQSSRVHDLKALFRLMDLQRRPGEVDGGRGVLSSEDFQGQRSVLVRALGGAGVRMGKIVLG